MASNFRPSTLRQTKHIEMTSYFHLSKLHRKSSSKRRRISSIRYFRRIDVILTSIRRQFDVFCPLGTQLFIVPPAVIKLELFESKRPKVPLKISEKVTINQSVIHSAD